MKRRFQEWKIPLFLFALSFGVYIFIITPNGFPDPDAFYHIKIVEFFLQQGIFTTFPWTQVSILKDLYIDHHFLYHIFLIPFVYVFDGMLGAKISIAFLGALFSVFLYKYLQSFGVRWPLFWVLLLFGTQPFLFRVSLMKANIFSLFFLFFAIHFLLRKKYIWLFLVSFLYVWAYGGWPFLFIIAVFSLIVSREYIRGVGTMLFGIAAGLMFNPYFPENIQFFRMLWTGVALTRYTPDIFIGAEWLSFSWHALFTQSLFFMPIFIFSAAIFFTYYKKQSNESRLFIMIAFLWYVATLRSRRNIEYFVPFGIVASALAVHFSGIEEMIFSSFKKEWILKRVAKIYLSIFIFCFFWYSIIGIKTTRASLLQFSKTSFRYQGAAEWLGKNTAPETVVFHPTWDEFPLLFYWNHKNYFIGGLDPRLSWMYDKEKYLLWEKIGDGRFKDDISDVIKENFHTKWVVVDKRHWKFEEQILKDENFIERFKGKGARVYEIQ